jgi:phospholipid/cholesterol/gamma-HCH transport system ATP-binding protein
LDQERELVSLRRVTLTYGLTKILERTDLRIVAGERIALVGQAGSGKTQLLRVLSSLVIPFFGSVRLFGQKLHRNQALLAQVRRSIGMQFQGFALFDSMTVLENAAFPLVAGLGLPEAEAQVRARAMLAQVGLGEFEGVLPGGLSGGQKRRLAVARALVGGAPLALFDDPVAGLDPVNSGKILDLIFAARAGVEGSTVVCAHDVDRLLPRVTRVLMLHKGRLVFDGSPEEFRRSEEPAAAAFTAALEVRA